jgi:hypothetical protein
METVLERMYRLGMGMIGVEVEKRSSIVVQLAFFD